MIAFKDGHLRRRPSTSCRRQIGRPNARPRTGCIARRTSFLRIVFKVLRLVYYCASVGADFYSFSYRTSCDFVARDQSLSPLHNLASGADYPLDATVCVYTAAQLYA